MRRRTVLAAGVGCLGVAGCLSRSDRPRADETDAPPASKGTGTETPVRRTANGVTATFRVVDAHRPTEATANASFDGNRVVVTGTIDPAGCREPTLRSVRYDSSTRTVGLVVGSASPYGTTATVECGNASYDFRCTVSVEAGPAVTVELVFDYHERAPRTFVLEPE